MKFRFEETIHSHDIYTARLGGKTDGTRLTKLDIGKALKLSGDSAFVLAGAGDPIEAFVTSVETDQGLMDGYHIGGTCSVGMKNATVVGAVVAIGDYVTAAAQGNVNTKLAGPMPVTKAADQAIAKAAPNRARVVSLGDVGTGAAGTVVVLKLVE